MYYLIIVELAQLNCFLINLFAFNIELYLIYMDYPEKGNNCMQLNLHGQTLCRFAAAPHRLPRGSRQTCNKANQKMSVKSCCRRPAAVSADGFADWWLLLLLLLLQLLLVLPNRCYQYIICLCAAVTNSFTCSRAAADDEAANLAATQLYCVDLQLGCRNSIYTATGVP